MTVTNQLETAWKTPLKTLKGEPTSLEKYKGKALMVVNVAIVAYLFVHRKDFHRRVGDETSKD